MAKRLTERQKDEIVKLFISGSLIEQLSKQFNCTKLTISRNLKKKLGENNYKQFSLKSKPNNELKDNKNQDKECLNRNKKVMEFENIDENFQSTSNKQVEEEFYELSKFIEVAPLNFDIENSTQKDLSSIPIADIELPKTVYMIVDKNVELETKYLKEPKFQSLISDERNAYSLEKAS